MAHEIFISHASQDGEVVAREIVDPLRARGVDAWFSRDCIRGAAVWERRIQMALEECAWFLVALSPHSVRSKWVQAEVDWALENRPEEQVIPVLLGDCNPSDCHLLLRRLQTLDFRSDPQSARRQLLLLLGQPLPPRECRLILPQQVPLELILIPAGQFVMGTAGEPTRDDERPAHPLRITRDFFLGRFPVTQQQYQAVVGAVPSHFRGDRHPVENISWEEATDFCRRLTVYLAENPAACGVVPGGPVEVLLPTEAEWEYACRAGSNTLFSFGDDRQLLAEYAWFEKNSGRTTHPVGQRKPNAWGLYDLHGNVWEWCRHRYSPDYTGAQSDDPTGPDTGDQRVLRGGSWSYYARDCRSARRHAAAPHERTANYGFRVAIRW